jgi:hypothetical protein
MQSLGKIAIYHYVKGNPAFDFGNPVTLASFTRHKTINAGLGEVCLATNLNLFEDSGALVA